MEYNYVRKIEKILKKNNVDLETLLYMEMKQILDVKGVEPEMLQSIGDYLWDMHLINKNLAAEFYGKIKRPWTNYEKELNDDEEFEKSRKSKPQDDQAWNEYLLTVPCRT